MFHPWLSTGTLLRDAISMLSRLSSCFVIFRFRSVSLSERRSVNRTCLMKAAELASHFLQSNLPARSATAALNRSV